MIGQLPINLANTRMIGNPVLRYGCAAVSIAVATELRLLLDPVLGTQFPFATLFLAVVVAAWFGLGPALTAVVLGAVAADYFLLPPRGSLALEGREEQIGLLLYLSTGVGIALLGGAMASALQRAERDALRARQQAVLIEQTYDSVLVWAWNGPITFWNHGAERLYGFSRAEAQGRISHELLRTSLPGGVGVFVAHLEAALSWEGELEHTTRDGRGIVVDSRMVLIHEGDRAYVIEVNRDITARREAEWALRDVNAQLESRVASRTAKLQAANQELEEFAYAASHDLKAPLRVIDNASRWLEDDLAEHLTAESRETMHLLRGRVKRMEKLLDDLLDYSRIGRTNEDLDSEICTGDALMANILALLAPADKFTVTVSASFADIRVRRMPLQQILMNLVSNAIKHHDKDKGRVDVSVEDRGDHLAFAVRDDGPGIAADFHEQIFKMFQTLKPRDRVEGSGMGLAMVRKNIAAFGGKLRLESAEGTGSVFAFTLPKRQKVRGDDA